ncbi:MAG: T9SS type A sorting domain-containing protein [Phaeodactylibacter sp.]|nr:T9SS type A sorting domain-containing protein [Phaeodactylibacter sp.]MCB9265898.1 T9SS type A sorting domain-containing protein [Lewinellaceae bacterium]MCB9288686.1 T9SS type A sorting domain-containing protein [Lewinellaceae bacterium]
MKSALLSILLIPISFVLSFAQYGQNSVGVGAVEYIEVLPNPNGSLDAGDGFTFEAWILNYGGPSNQKVAGKLVSDFKNGFIYGIEDLQVNLEVFDNNGTNTRLKAGSISGIGWTHVAGSYEVGGMLTIYVNGKKAGETAASAVPVNPNTNPFRIGIAPWDVNALGLVGYVDELRYWQAVLDEATIREWMHKDVTADHPNYDKLSLYHKYNETEGPAVVDETANDNFGIFSSESIALEPAFLPFKGEFEMYENDLQGIWNAKTEGSSDILSFTGTFFDSLALEVSAIFGHSDGDYSFDTDAPGNYDRSLSKAWQVATQGELFVNFSFDLSMIDMSQVEEVVLLSSPEEDFSNADVTSGTLDGSTFAVEEIVPVDGWYYTLGFKTTISGTRNPVNQALHMEVSPNPSKGIFRLHVEREQPGALQVRVLNLAGEVLYNKATPNVPATYTEWVDPGHLAPGMYLVEVRGAQQAGIRKLAVK